ncbi:hypothetical protein RB2280 [Rhodopirellula baltica SH 1]|uniref:Uncharacterized protein n=1 Tax=Rhodopirellula baltica (strain DSM 10527 / NCIMB 13988 / SH1) TaxID=243090 RepID=Q7UW41_RHOBA|nr:hypothetical protein RB2280 [Rhodopirellula baltica SH 1]
MRVPIELIGTGSRYRRNNFSADARPLQTKRSRANSFIDRNKRAPSNLQLGGPPPRADCFFSARFAGDPSERHSYERRF